MQFNPKPTEKIVRFLYNVYTFSYKILFFKVGKVTTNVSRKKIFPGEIETISNINPQFINEIFKLKENKRLTRERYNLIVEVPK